MNPGDVEIISARDTMHELPVLVFEGLYRMSSRRLSLDNLDCECSGVCPNCAWEFKSFDRSG